jgi:hypothetical protein
VSFAEGLLTAQAGVPGTHPNVAGSILYNTKNE